jgi:hypothetical protein
MEEDLNVQQLLRRMIIVYKQYRLLIGKEVKSQ